MYFAFMFVFFSGSLCSVGLVLLSCVLAVATCGVMFCVVFVVGLIGVLFCFSLFYLPIFVD
jgi:hypothetical protein